MHRIKPGSATGVLEVDGICAAFAAVDAAAKAADVQIESLERTREGSYVCIKMRGDVSSVTASMETAIAVAEKVAAVGPHAVIAAPTQDTEKTLVYSNI